MAEEANRREALAKPSPRSLKTSAPALSYQMNQKEVSLLFEGISRFLRNNSLFVFQNFLLRRAGIFIKPAVAFLRFR